MILDPDYPFEYETCEHDKDITDPAGIGICTECFAMNVALSSTDMHMEEVEATYTIMAGLQGMFEAMDDEE